MREMNITNEYMRLNVNILFVLSIIKILSPNYYIRLISFAK